MAVYHFNPVSSAAELCSGAGHCSYGSLYDESHGDKEAVTSYGEALLKRLKKPSSGLLPLYRLGPLGNFHKNSEVQEFYQLMDRENHPRRLGRADAIFGSPTLDSVGRWLGCREEVARTSGIFEVMVKAEAVWVYPISGYEVASHHCAVGRMKLFEKSSKIFWNSGMYLGEWHAWAQEACPRRGTWEVLFTGEQMESFRRLTWDEVLEGAHPLDRDRLF